MGLTVKRVERARKPGRYSDGQGLYLQITPDGVRSWLLRYGFGTNPKTGKPRERFMGLGPVHTVSLEEARERARQARQLLLDGIDPIAARQAEKTARQLADAKVMTFAEAAQAFFDQRAKGWRNRKHTAQFINTLKQYAFPYLGNLPVSEIDKTHVLKVLEQKVPAERGHPAGVFWNVRTETASRLRGRIETILNWAGVRGYREGENPARWKGYIEHALPKRGEVAPIEHHAAMPYAAIPQFMATLRQREGVAAQALEFTILTAARTGEVIGATWDEIDLDKKTWTVPAGRMKASKEHRVPLSDRAVELLNNLYREDGNNFLFIGSQRGSALSNMAMTMTMRRIGQGETTVHGFRSTFMDWAHEHTAFPKVVIDMALAHTVGDKVEAAYRRGELLDKRRKLMEAWAAYCSSPIRQQGGDVVPLRAR